MSRTRVTDLTFCLDRLPEHVLECHTQDQTEMVWANWVLDRSKHPERPLRWVPLQVPPNCWPTLSLATRQALRCGGKHTKYYCPTVTTEWDGERMEQPCGGGKDPDHYNFFPTLSFQNPCTRMVQVIDITLLVIPLSSDVGVKPLSFLVASNGQNSHCWS